jgi:hypothetical protein
VTSLPLPSRGAYFELRARTIDDRRGLQVLEGDSPFDAVVEGGLQHPAGVVESSGNVDLPPLVGELDTLRVVVPPHVALDRHPVGWERGEFEREVVAGSGFSAALQIVELPVREAVRLVSEIHRIPLPDSFAFCLTRHIPAQN